MKNSVRKVILLIDNSREFERGLLRGITKYAQSHGPWNIYMIPSYFIGSRVAARKREIRHLKSWGAEGIIAREVIDIDEILSLNLPTVLSSHTRKICKGVSNIVVDNLQVGRMAAEHLLDRSFRHFAFCDYRNYFWSREEYEGFRDRIEEAGCLVHYYHWPKSSSLQLWDYEQPRLVKWLRQLPKPVGLMACVDERSRDVNEACKTAGLYVPEEVAIIGTSNDEFLCRLSNPSLSSVSIDSETAGYQAAHLLDKKMGGEIRKCQVIDAFPTHVICRGSTNIMAVDDADVAEAINFIRRSAGHPIQVRDVVEHTGVGRTILYGKFQKTIGRSINQEIKRARIEKIVSMLINSRASISQIARDIGMHPEHLSRYFASAKGMSPEAFRRQYSRKR